VPYEQVYRKGFEDMRRRVPDVTKLRRTVGFVPDTPLEQSLLRIIEDCRARLRQARTDRPRFTAAEPPAVHVETSTRQHMPAEAEPAGSLSPEAIPTGAGIDALGVSVGPS
jgi:hypothetical protein